MFLSSDERDALTKLWFWYARRKARKAAKRRKKDADWGWRGAQAWRLAIENTDTKKHIGWVVIVGEERLDGKRRIRVVQTCPGYDHERAPIWGHAKSWEAGLTGEWKKVKKP